MKTIGAVALAVLFTLALTIDVPGQGEGPRLDVKLVADGLVAPSISRSRPTAAAAASSWIRLAWSSS